MRDLISRQAAIDVVDSETISTNPEHFKSSEKFIEFMDDSDISSFGKWQWSNGFNTALVAVRIDLKKLPTAQPEIIRCKDCKHYYFADNRVEAEQCHVCGYWDFEEPKPDGFCNYAERREDR